MNNTDLNGRLIQEAQMIMEEARRAFNGKAWNLVVRRSQEVVELSLMGLLKLMGVESPKSLFEKYICRVRTAHQPLKAPEGRKVCRNATTP